MYKRQIDNKVFSKLGNGLLVLLGIENEDSDSDIEWLSSKISQMRIFDDKNDNMNLSVNDINGEVLVVSQFTLHASTKKGNRPSYIRASKPDHAVPMYEAFILQMKDKILNGVSSGQFGACMQVDLVNDGPVTIWIDSKNRE